MTYNHEAKVLLPVIFLHLLLQVMDKTVDVIEMGGQQQADLSEGKGH